MLYDIAHVSEKSTGPPSGRNNRDKMVETNMAEQRHSADNELNFQSHRTS